MKRIYRAFLCLYPREYRDLFGPEVLSVFEQAAEEHRARGWSVWVWFLVTELSGAAVSAAGHWIDRFPACRRSPAADTPGAARSGLFSAANEARNRVDFNLNKMTDAIANHDFAGARDWSYKERKAREDLRRLRDRYGFDE